MLYTFVMEKDFTVIGLFGLYGNLLTEHQKELFNLYYECDLSLGEIADIKGISRQSVNDALKKSREILTQTENSLKMYEKFSLISQVVEYAENSGEYKTAIEKIKNSLEEV